MNKATAAGCMKFFFKFIFPRKITQNFTINAQFFFHENSQKTQIFREILLKKGSKFI